jgi:haloalkane dehalogenase
MVPERTMVRVLLTSVCRPLGPSVGDAPSVGYELLHGQVTRAQGLFSPRSHHLHFSLEYIAENLDAPCVVLQYPSKEELIRELGKGYDYVCVSFLLAVFHKMRDLVALVREHAPQARIVLGGYGTVLPDEVLAPFGDVICREEGVAFMRELLGEPPREMPYRHPLIVSRLRVFGRPVSRTGMVFAGLGCPNGCDFCCTSHFFKRRHIKLLPTGADIHRVVERYLDLDPEISLVILDEDFLLNRRRAMEFRDCVLRSGRALSIFAFASVRALSQYRVEEIVEMGIDGLWIGYEGTRSGYAKQKGRSPDELFPELRQHGISILASMIVGLPYQDEAIVERELEGLLRLEPDLCQFLIYGPTPGTPFYEQTVADGLLREEFVEDPDRYYKACDGFTSMTEHPTLAPTTIEALQRRCFDRDFEVLGPTLYRSISTWFAGYRTLRASGEAVLQRKAERFARDIRRAYPVFLAGRLFGPNAVVRQRIKSLQREVEAELGRPSFAERLTSLAAVVLAIWTSLTLRMGWFQHPRLVKHTYRVPAEAPRPSRAWRRIARLGEAVSLELRSERTVWVQLRGALVSADAEQLAVRVRKALERTRNRLVLDLERLTDLEREAAQALATALRDYRDRIRILVPASLPEAAAALGVFALYHGAELGADIIG